MIPRKEWRRVAKQGQVGKKEHAGKLCHIYIYLYIDNVL